MPGALTIRELLTRYSFKTDTKPIKVLDNAVANLKKRVAAIDKKLIGAFKSIAKVSMAGAVGFAAASVKLASDAAESESKFAAVFKDQEGQVRQWSDAIAKQMGRSGFKIREFAAGLQDTFVPMGFARDQAAQLSQNLTELALDVASFQNKAEPDVIRDFQAAIVGNTETVRKYGIVITKARLDAKIKALSKEMPGFSRMADEQQKILARYRMILEGTSDAHGDATRTSGSFANQLKGLKARVERVMIAVGQKLLPIVGKWVETAAKWIDANEDLLKQKVGEAVEKLAEVLAALGRVLGWVIENWKAVVAVAGVLVGGRILFGIYQITSGLMGTVNALVAVTKGASKATSVLGGAITKAGGFGAALGKVGAIGAALTAGWVAGEWIDKQIGATEQWAEMMHRVGDEARRAKSIVTGQVAKVDQLRDRARQLAELQKKGVKSVELERGGERVALDRAGIVRILKAQATKLGIGEEMGRANVIGNLMKQEGLAPATQPAAGSKTEVKVDRPTFQLNVPPGTTAAQAKRLGEETTAALMASMRRAMGDVQR